jgi:hypothetical protein
MSSAFVRGFASSAVNFWNSSMNGTVARLVTLFSCVYSWKPVATPMCASVSPIERVSGDALNEYWLSGISSAILMVLLRTVRNASASSLPP